jgi:polyisoprenyl-teichoic acid--peptidoglycan teichoic acid transferase
MSTSLDPASTRLEPDGAEPARADRRPRRVLPLLLSVLGLLLVAGLLGAFAYVLSVDRSVNQNLQRGPDLLPAESPTGTDQLPRPPARASDKSVNFVLLGVDDDSGGSSRSDALMVLHLPASRDAAYLISFPRDMYVPIPGRGSNKINAAYAFGGTRLTIRTLEGILDTRMDHVAVVDFKGFIGLTEELGGVQVYNKHSSESGGYKFPAGKITVRGPEALAYVRERMTLPRGDLDRAERQRELLQAIFSKGLSGDTIRNPAKFVAFTGGVAKHVKVDDRLTSNELRALVLSLRMTPDDLRTLQAPILGFGRTSDNQSIDRVDWDQLERLSEALDTDDMAAYVQRYGS